VQARALPGAGARIRGPADWRGIRGGGTLCGRRWRLPGDALIKREVGLRLAEEVPVRHRLGIIILGRWSAGRGDPRRLGGLADMREGETERSEAGSVAPAALHWGGLGDEGSALLGVRCRSESGHYPRGGQCRFWVGTCLLGDALRRMASSVEPASKHTSAASAFRKLSRIVAAAGGDRRASEAAARRSGQQRQEHAQS
jgi:hypothetical protein